MEVCCLTCRRYVDYCSSFFLKNHKVFSRNRKWCGISSLLSEFKEQTERMNRRYLQFYKERNFDGIASMYSKNCRFMPAGFPMQNGPDGTMYNKIRVKAWHHCHSGHVLLHRDREFLENGGRAGVLLALVRDARVERDVWRARDRALSLRVPRRERKRNADWKVRAQHDTVRESLLCRHRRGRCRYIVVWEKEDGQWKYHWDIWNPDSLKWWCNFRCCVNVGLKKLKTWFNNRAYIGCSEWAHRSVFHNALL